jgi:1,4-dihydroxy-2-naphthoate octaprenyltransferase
MRNLNIISWFDKATIQHLRFPFSYHLMPVFLFALSQATIIEWKDTIIAFFILHLLIYPSSNGYNSYQDKDETSIGGLKNPPKVSENLFYATLLMDVLGVALSFFVSSWFALFVLIYILISRAYSYRKLRLKKFAFTGFLTVFIFQGAFTYLMVTSAVQSFNTYYFSDTGTLICMLIASLFIGSVYPLTQIYQHEADKKDNVTTISYILGYTGTFIFSALMFSGATALLMFYFDMQHQRLAFFLFGVLMLPVIIKLLTWFGKVRENPRYANFENTMAMNLLASTCMNIYFLVLILNSIYRWF